MPNYSLPKYDEYRKWIRQARERGCEWGKIKYGLRNDPEELEIFLKEQKALNWWDIDCNDWFQLVESEKESEEQTKTIDYMKGYAMIYDEGQDNEVSVPSDEKSSWQLYKKKLLTNGFKPGVVEEMERTTVKILKRLSNNTVDKQPIKGLVIGNVQSGKTANMAALMAMAADWGWNLFIVLSGTIENLRQQTQKRLLEDLNNPGNLNWRGLEHLSRNPSYGQRTQDLHFEEDSKDRYFTVCLKNAVRLKKLIQWLHSDPNKQRQMKILVIDDEADQAGINTADIESNERKTINRLIVNLVNGKNEKGEDTGVQYRAMNYIGYTATPYANVLNESSRESLYPRNFITTLGVSKEYFGPQHIFGVDGGDYEGMDILRIIENQELNLLKNIHDGMANKIPESLQNALCWFLCGTATMRYWKLEMPASMLVHTSQKQDHHQCIADSIRNWLESDAEYILNKCRKVWEYETERFSFEKFRKQYPDYDRREEEINKYPGFDDIEPEIRKILKNVSNIPLGSDGDLVYHEGIHLCIDNCSQPKGINEDGMYVRLAYPDSKNILKKVPAFIVVGGATLSRGLTIEGLISSYFLRSVNQADTLMQMGRWFGYRRGYELLPRIWLTSKTYDQFVFLSTLDEELREEIRYMDQIRISPSEYGPKIKNTPKYSFIRITAKSKMQSARPADMDLSGQYSQTYLFYNDKEILKSNINVVTKFIEGLGKPEGRKPCNKHAENTLIWRNIPFTKIYQMLKEYRAPKRLMVFNDIDIEGVADWINKMTSEGKLTDWNVVVAGTASKEKIWKLTYGEIGKVRRTRKKNYTDKNIINIGVLRDPKDLIADVDLEGKDAGLINRVMKFKAQDAKSIRSEAGLNMTPQLLIYMIDKDSKADSESNREDLNAPEDIVGLCLNIPGGKRGTNYAAKITIRLENNPFDDNGDLEGVNDVH